MYVLKKNWALFIYCSLLVCSLFVVQTVQANFYDVGLRDIKFQDFNFYNPKAETGKQIQKLYLQYAALKKIEFYHMPEDFEPIIDEVHQYVQNNSKQFKKANDSDPNGFYSGINGERNGVGFTFNKEDLPTKIVRLAFCFGIDPIVYTGLLKQESKFSTHALSRTKASGFSQLTTDAIVEVSEQLGILSQGYASDGAEDALTQYIECYYIGYDKKWVNIWEDGTIPRGRDAYKGGKLGNGRQWLYVTKSKDWLNEDPDRNLIYGAAYFKAMLNRSNTGGNYYRALARYNVAQQQVYTNKIKRYYRELSPGVSTRINAKDWGFLRIGYEHLEFEYIENNMGRLKCSVPIDDGSLQMFKLLKGLYAEQDLLKGVQDYWGEQHYCKNQTILM